MCFAVFAYLAFAFPVPWSICFDNVQGNMKEPASVNLQRIVTLTKPDCGTFYLKTNSCGIPIGRLGAKALQ